MEVLDTAEEWQEFDGDIFVDSPKGMKMIKLLSKKTHPLSFSTKSIDSIFFRRQHKKHFRIIGNLYSDDKIEIIEVKTIKEFSVMKNK